MAAPPEPVSVIVSSVEDVANAIQDNHINNVNQAHLVTFELDEQTSLQEAFNLSVKTNAGNDGCKWENYEMLKCKVKAKQELEALFMPMQTGSMNWFDAELERVQQSILGLKIIMRSTDEQIDNMHLGTALAERNQGPQQCIYPHPPFPEDPSFEYGLAPARVRFRPPTAAQDQMDQAADRDRRSQRAVWDAKLQIEEARLSTLKDFKLQMMVRMKEEFDRILLKQSDLGVGYANYQEPELA